MGNSQRNKQSYERRAFSTVNVGDGDSDDSDSTEPFQDDCCTSDPKKGFDRVIRILVVGDSHTGKTNFVKAFSGEPFQSLYMATIGIDIKIGNAVLDGMKIKSQTFDTAGQERFHSITHSHLRSAMGVFLVFDVTNEVTFNGIRKWIREIRTNSLPNIPIMLVGNKCDKRTNDFQGHIQYEKAKNLADELNLPFIETSCKDGTNVEYAYISMLALASKRTKDVI